VVFVVGFAVRLADISISVAVGNNIRLFMAGGCRRSEMDDGTHEARVTAGERGRFRLVDQRSRIPPDRYCDQPAMDPKGGGECNRRAPRRRRLVVGRPVR
jgi:hypothetical protein